MFFKQMWFKVSGRGSDLVETWKSIQENPRKIPGQMRKMVWKIYVQRCNWNYWRRCQYLNMSRFFLETILKTNYWLSTQYAVKTAQLWRKILIIFKATLETFIFKKIVMGNVQVE